MEKAFIKKSLLTILLFGVINFASALPIDVYSTDFESGVGAVWSSSSSSSNGDVGKYHGNFTTTGSTTLTLTGLAAHTQVSLKFDLYLFSTWDGEDTTFGKDYFSLSGDVTGSWTFTNHQTEGQSYPGVPDETYGTGAAATHVYRGLDSTGTGSEFLVSHSGSSFSVTFAGPTTQTDEWWGIDNVRVSIDTSAVPEPSTILLFGLGILGLTVYRKKTVA